ncbi:hypothetical protein [Caenimonas sp. SL110]|uniref:hypothetical protein n=1 Tax=Caenimonas sp. SL110 TaxID=1450524 RepID=UPI00069E55B3|nr:hypothetical protein [Caenimonas sp. SL110]
MRHSIRQLFSIVGFALVAAAASGAHAQATRTWVSGVGDDANPCSRTAPCKTFAGAISKTAAGGVISILDPGGFGGVTITKAMTIDGTGSMASILSAQTSGIVVNAGTNDRVVIRNVSIEGSGTCTFGVNYLNGGWLVVENVDIHRCGTGVHLATTADNGRADLRNVTITGATTGLHNQSPTSMVMVDKSVFRSNGTGILTERGDVALKASSVLFNTQGITKSGGGFSSFGDNVFFGNANNGNGLSLIRDRDLQ